MWTTHSAETAVHPIKRNGSAHVPAGTSQCARRANAIRNSIKPLLRRSGRRVRRIFSIACMVTASLRATATAARLKPILLPEFEPPGPQTAVGRAAGQDDRRRFVEEPAQMAIAPPRDMAVIVDLLPTGIAGSSGRARRRPIGTS